ncbi:uncharacterized protein M6B38_397200 [Iris pallida]|uniref:S phase cyclin A-associated protein in the endoplasmic reticulum N-terminal domain-containing protein n=1 Tax=Iris pallida TaxID=29817 RepID=A0AAX6FWN8_IRIPA|nr:uncharacterized protein M6B38_397200 [Iris pallida]
MLRDSPALSLEGTLEVVPQETHDRFEKGALHVSEVDATNDDRGMSIQDTISLSHQADATEISGEASLISATDLRGLHNIMEGTVLGESEEGESKERFRERLWCFLFENLNRAVDELYLLCELECDIDQMNEAILVLEDASSDFKELKCRVEHFENTKRSTTQSSKDGMPITAKADNRRPHALSWEVRRMTTSPRRAEILSSSLEAFKKVQLERTRKHVNQDETIRSKSSSTAQHLTRSSPRTSNLPPETREPNTEKQGRNLDSGQGITKVENSIVDAARQSRASSAHNGHYPPQNPSVSASGKSKREKLEPIAETEKQLSRKDKAPVETKMDKQLKANDIVKKQTSVADKEKEKEKERRNTTPWKPIDAWKEKRNWEDILKSPLRNSSRVSHSPGLARKGMERARVLHDKLMSPEKRRKTALDMKKEAEEKHARAMRIRSQLENERVQRLQRTSEKLNRVNEWQAVRSLKLREGMHARHRQSESRHEAYLAQVARRAGDESSKVNEVRFITSLNEENKKFILRQKLQDSEMRRAEKLQVIKTKQKEDTAREEAVLERRKLLEAEKLQRLAETQRKKEEAQVRREEERKASSAAREAKALEQLRKKEVRAKAQQEEAELLAQKLAERLSESEQRRNFYLEQIREKASMDFRDQSSPLLRRPLNKEGQSRSMSTNSIEDYQTSFISSTGNSIDVLVTATQQQSLKRRIKKIRQRLMALKYEFTETPIGADNSVTGYRALVGTARAKIGRWLQDLQKLRQARKEGAASIGLIVGDMVKFLEGKDPELQASRQAGLLDFISSALPASHTSKPEACQVTVYLLQLLRVLLSAPANQSYFLVQNLLPPIIPMLSASLENYIKIAASSSPGSGNSVPSKTSTDNLESITEVLDGFLWTVTIIIGCAHTDDRQLQMQDGLQELIVSYQIIHRLRDLFALYDRPQVEGNPFPSSILLSLNLLVALTSRSRTISPIDWEDCISKVAPATKIQETKGSECTAIDEFSFGDKTKHVVANIPFESGQMSEEKLQFTVTGIPESRSSDGEGSVEVASGLDDVGTEKHVETTSGEVLLDENANKLSPEKCENTPTDVCTVRKRNSEFVVHDSIGNKKDHGLKQPHFFFLL